MKTRFILINTSHAGNVGGAARAMKVMGFDDLVLVEPRWDDVLARDETIERASGAVDVLRKARAVETLSRQLSETIVWSDCMDAAAEAGMTVALELGPGAALARMLQARHPHIACRSVADFRSLDGIVAWLGRHVDTLPVA